LQVILEQLSCSAKLESWGFVTNPYDPCVVNKIINCTQCTILWHIDDLKISHINPNVVTSVINQLLAEFGKEALLTVSRRKIHEYLGMTLDYTLPGKVQIQMINYIDTMLSELDKDMAGEFANSAPNHLLTVNPSCLNLPANKSITFHHNVAKLLFLCKHARPNIQLPTAFLCTRVKAPYVDNYKKLARVMRYLRATCTMSLTLEAGADISIIKWWVDASFAVHPNMCGHTGAVMTLSQGAMHAMSGWQKLNTKSSTEGKLVGVSDAMGQILWTRYFFEAQGYPIHDSVVYQDNQSAMLLEKNGRASSSKQTCHINI
jgi:hypothetical protein